jgi:MFS family permease
VPLSAALAPLAHRPFAWLCAGTTISALGTWIQATASAWVMTDLAPDALMVSLIQAAAQLPILVLAIPAGALADLVERRRYLILTNAWMLAAAAALAALYALDQIGPWLLLALTALLAAGAAMEGPAWSSSVPLTVPRESVSQGLVVNAMGFNLARAIGPALGGVILASAGAAAAFAANAASYAVVAAIVGLVLALPRAAAPDGLPPEPKLRAMSLGVRYVLAEPNVCAALVRSLAFYGLASAIWALLPLYVHEILHLSSASYGGLLGAIGIGAVAAGAVMPRLTARLSRDAQVMLGGVVCSAALIPVALAPSAATAAVAMLAYGFGWMVASSILQTAVQLACAPWVRARGVAIYQAVFNAGMGFGAIAWGFIATQAGVTGTLLAAGIGGIGMALVARTQRLPDEIADPSQPWHGPLPTFAVHDAMTAVVAAPRQPVIVTVAYQVDVKNAAAFRDAMAAVASARRRDGAFGWELTRDIERPECWVEAFRVADWDELQRGMARLNLVDADASAAARAYHRGAAPPAVRVMATQPP